MSYTEQDILTALNHADVYYWPLDLEHPYTYTAGSRITLFADEERWAAVFEKTGYNPRGGRADLELYYFGNCLHDLDRAGAEGRYLSNVKYFPVIDGDAFAVIEDEQEGEGIVSRAAPYVRVREQGVAIDQDVQRYTDLNIPLEDDADGQPRISYEALTRRLDEANPGLFRATDEEFRTCLPPDLPKLLVIDQFHHVQCGYGEDRTVQPSETETIQLIARVLATRDPARWQPTLPPNNDWRNWPEAGWM